MDVHDVLRMETIMFKTRENETSAPVAELIDLGKASVETRGNGAEDEDDPQIGGFLPVTGVSAQ